MVSVYSVASANTTMCYPTVHIKLELGLSSEIIQNYGTVNSDLRTLDFSVTHTGIELKANIKLIEIGLDSFLSIK